MNNANGLKIENKCLACDKRAENFFCNLSQTNRQIFESLKIKNYYPKGAMLFVEGQPANGIYVLCRGRVKLSTCSKDGKVIILHIAEAGEVLGLSAAVSDSVHIATAEAIEPCQVNFVRNKDFLRFLEQNAEACMNAVRQLSQNYQSACLQICTLGLAASVADKLATLFLGWCKASVEDKDGIHLKISYTHEELAQMIGTSRETVTRILKSFRDRHLINRKGSEFIIPDRRKLEAVIGTRQGNIVL
jgi:CRP/FNR family transcriptional regulator, cyclic AMP receptor protein